MNKGWYVNFSTSKICCGHTTKQNPFFLFECHKTGEKGFGIWKTSSVSIKVYLPPLHFQKDGHFCTYCWWFPWEWFPSPCYQKCWCLVFLVLWKTLSRIWPVKLGPMIGIFPSYKYIYDYNINTKTYSKKIASAMHRTYPQFCFLSFLINEFLWTSTSTANGAHYFLGKNMNIINMQIAIYKICDSLSRQNNAWSCLTVHWKMLVGHACTYMYFKNARLILPVKSLSILIPWAWEMSWRRASDQESGLLF